MSIFSRIRGQIRWLAVIGWMMVIFAASSDAASGHRSSRIIGPIVKWLYPSISPSGMEQIILGVRKAAHVTEYAILAALLGHAFRKTRVSRPFGAAWVVSVLYAATDEWHQSFVPTRVGSWQDVVIDSCGAALGLLIVWWGSRLALRKQGKPQNQV